MSQHYEQVYPTVPFPTVGHTSWRRFAWNIPLLSPISLLALGDDSCNIIQACTNIQGNPIWCRIQCSIEWYILLPSDILLSDDLQEIYQHNLWLSLFLWRNAFLTKDPRLRGWEWLWNELVERESIKWVHLELSISLSLVHRFTNIQQNHIHPLDTLEFVRTTKSKESFEQDGNRTYIFHKPVGYHWVEPHSGFMLVTAPSVA